jgi:hypothetical protein
MTFATIVNFINMFSTIKSAFEGLMVVYVQAKVASMKKENRDAIIEAFIKHDQRAIEKALGNTNAGGASNAPGSQIVDDLPGVTRP